MQLPVNTADRSSQNSKSRRLVMLACLLTVMVGCNSSQTPGPTVDTSQFDQDLQSGELVLVKFGAKWCGPCMKIDKELEQLASQGTSTKIIQVDVDSNPELASRFKVGGIPHTILVRNGETLDQRVGYMALDDIAEWTASYSAVKTVDQSP